MATINELPGGKFRVQWYDSSGVRQRKILPKKQAKELFEQVSAQKIFEKSGISPALGARARNFRNMTFEELANKYMVEHLLNTRAADNALYVKTLIRKWGKYRLYMLRPSAFREWIWFALDNPIETPLKDGWGLSQLAAGSVEKLVRYHTAIFYFGVEREIVDHNPFARLKDSALRKEFRRRKKRFKAETLTVEEFWNYANTLPAYVRDPAICCFFSGIRRGELSKIKWSKTNRKQHYFFFEADEVKEADEKKVYYDPELEEVLERLQIEYLTSGYTDDAVFRNEKGEPLTEDSFSGSVKYYSRKYAENTGNDKFLKVSPHTFRRSYRTRKDREGMDRKAVAANMGHHSLSTSEIYNIVDEDRQRTVAGYLEENSTEVKEPIEKLIETARQSGLSLADLQSELRIKWRSVHLKNAE